MKKLHKPLFRNYKFILAGYSKKETSCYCYLKKLVSVIKFLIEIDLQDPKTVC